MVPIVIARVSYSSNNTDSIGTNGTPSINLSALQRYQCMVLDEYLIVGIIPTISLVAVLAVLAGAPNGS